jgi:hypothetical protein
VRIVIRGHQLPGRQCGSHTNVYVGLQVGSRAEGLVAGDALAAEWEAEVRVVEQDLGRDFRGPAVHGKRGERFLYLTWGSPTGDDWGMFRRAKLMLDPAYAEAAVLVGTLALTDAKGGPLCARVVPPAIEWTPQASGARSL